MSVPRDANVGDIAVADIVRNTRRSGRQFSEVTHIVRVEHFYGKDTTTAWVKPLCGAKAGRATYNLSGRICSRCEASAERQGIEVPS